MNNILQEINNLLAKELEELKAVSIKYTFSFTELLQNIISHTQKMSGKRIRVLLAFLISKMYNCQNVDIIKIVAAIDFIHNATLLHDDVIDCNTNRRNLVTANEIWSNKACILAGDFLLSKAFTLISSVNNSQISMLFAETSSILIEGEINQLIYNDEQDVDLEKYIAVVGAKTASLFSLATIVGPVFTNADKSEIDQLRQFGYSLGIAFQIKDDLLDYLGTYESLGKPIGVDYKEKKMTLPLLILKYKLLEDNLENIWLNEIWNPDYSEEKLKQVINYMKQYSIGSMVNVYIDKYIDIARNSLNGFEKFNDFYRILIDLTNFVVNRDV